MTSPSPAAPARHEALMPANIFAAGAMGVVSYALFAWFPYASPALFSMAIGFFGVWLFSVLDKSAQAAKERAVFPAQQVRSETGLGAAGASGH